MATTPRWVYAVNTTLSTLSVCGGLAIIAGFCLAPAQQRKALRPLLILALGVTDILQGAVVLAGNARELTGNPFEPNSPGCLASGFLYQTAVISVSAWTLTIALTTYITLVHPFSRASAALEHRFAFPAIVLTILLLGISPSIAVTVHYDMIDAGGLCWLRSGTVPASLMLFIPRATVLLLTILLYLRLFIFFRTRDTKLLDTTTEHDDDEGDRRMSKRLSMASLRLSNWSNRRSSEATRASPPAGHGHLSPTSAPLSPIPGSPAIAFSTPFGPTSAQSASAHHSVSISFPPSNGSPTQSVESTPVPEDYGSPALPHAGMHPKRPSSVAFPPRFSVVGDQSPNAEPKETRLSSREKRAKVKRPLSPRQINRRLSLLMMLYPAAYVILVAVACARLIQTFSRGGKSADPALRYASIFLIYSQGAIDGILFVVVAVVFRRWSRRD
ncbi:hypothetical protein JCM6882_001855 [Rhodosporidiobolus microsporus]